MPGWQTFTELNKSGDFVFIAVAMDVGGINDVKPLYEGAGAKYITLVDPQNAMGEAWGFKVVPNGWLIDESGTVVFKQLGGFEVRSPKTIETVEKFLQIAPAAKGEIKAAKSDKERIVELKNAISSNPDNGEANLELGQILLRQGKAKLAQNYLGAATRLMPKSGAAMFALASSIVAQGDKKTGLIVLKNALKLDPSNYLIRKQIWHLEFPEKFHPEIDWAWQREQMKREREAEKAGGG